MSQQPRGQMHVTAGVGSLFLYGRGSSTVVRDAKVGCRLLCFFPGLQADAAPPLRTQPWRLCTKQTGLVSLWRPCPPVASMWRLVVRCVVAGAAVRYGMRRPEAFGRPPIR